MALAIGLAACGSSGSDASEAESSSYVEEVEVAWAPALEARDRVAEQSEIAYSERARARSIGQSDDAIESLDEVAARFAAIMPPPESQEDHTRLLAMVDEVRGQLDLRRAAYADDRVGDAAIAEMRLFVAANAAAVDVAPELCRVVLDPGGELCANEPAFDDSYAGQVRETFQAFSAGFGPRVGGVPLAGTDEEVIAYLEEIQPEVTELLETTRERLEALEPGSERQEGHELLVAYLADTLVIAEQISAAAEAGNAARLRELFVESGAPLERTTEGLSSEMRERLAFLFDAP